MDLLVKACARTWPVLASSIVLLLAACVGLHDPALLDEASSGHGPYAAALKVGYKHLAEEERAEYDWRDSDFFFLRARASDGDDPPMPQEVTARNIPPGRDTALLAARDRLMVSHSEVARLKAPAELAQTQVAFDCWLQEEEEGHQAEDIAACRERFFDALLRLETRLAQRSDLIVVLAHADGTVGGVEVNDGTSKILLDRPLAAVETGDAQTRVFDIAEKEVSDRFGDALGAQPVPPRSFTLYFEENAVVLVPASASVVEDIAADIKTRESPEIMVIGHADTVGNLSYNDRLSSERARAVISYLADRGFAREKMAAAGRGERELLVPTANNVPEPRNRRVEISIR